MVSLADVARSIVARDSVTCAPCGWSERRTVDAVSMVSRGTGPAIPMCRDCANYHLERRDVSSLNPAEQPRHVIELRAALAVELPWVAEEQ